MRNAHRSICLVVLCLVFLFVISNSLQAGEGSLDAAFGVGGKVTTDFLGSSNDAGNAVAIQGDGKILVAGSTDDAVNSNFALLRYNTNGSLDAGFGISGVATTDFGANNDFGNAVVIQSDGKILVAGESNEDFAVARYNSNGTPDTLFGVGGIVTTDFDADLDIAYAVVVQTDGKIVVAGRARIAGSTRFAVARYLTNGLPDTAFDFDGMLTTNIDAGADVARAIVLQPDGKIVVAGYSGQDDFAMVRYNSLDGSPDITFDSDGIVIADFSATNDRAFAMALQSDGKILLAGRTDAGGGGDNFALARFTTLGALDPTFDLDGRVLTDFAFDDEEAFGIVLQSDGKILLAGRAIITGNENFAVARYTTFGMLDGTFDLDGKVTTDLGAFDEARAVALRSGGKILAVGRNDGNFDTGNDIGLVTYNSNGSVDGSFGTAGIVTTDILRSADDSIRSVALQTDGKIIVAGTTNNAGSRDFGLVRYTVTGALDASFGIAGLVRTDFGFRDDSARAVVIQPDGKILVAGFSGISGVDDFALARYNSNGSLDTSFGTGGLVLTDFATGDDEAHAVALQADNRIVVAGFATIGPDEDFALARYNTDGTLDVTFATFGVTTTDFNGSTDNARAVAIQPDGAIVAAGFSNNGDDEFALARYLSTGFPDITFSGDGLVTDDFNGNDDQIHSIVLQADGSIVAAGFADGMGSEVFALARFLTGGTLDPAFQGGDTTTDLAGAQEEIHSVLLQPDGKIIAAGYRTGPGGRNFALVRYSSTGAVDGTFGSAGSVNTDFQGDDDQIHSAVLQADGKLVAAGQSIDAVGNPDFAVARYVAICPAMTVSPGTLPDGNVGFVYSQTISVTGSVPPFTFTVTSGSLPPGLTLNPSTGLLSGTPTTQGTYNFTITVSDANTCFDAQSYSLFISPCPPITVSPDSMPNGNTSSFFSQTITPNGATAPFTFNVSAGSLPPGLNLDSNTGVLSGTPTTLGVYNFTVTITDNAGCIVNKAYTINVVNCLFCDDFADSVLAPAGSWTYSNIATWSEDGANLVGSFSKKTRTFATPIFAGCSLCSFEATLRTAGGIGNYLSLVGWYQNSQNYVELMMKQETGKWLLKQRVNGTVVAKSKGLAPINVNQFYTANMVYDGTQFQVFIDGNLLITLTKAAGSSPSGTAGFVVKASTGSFGYILVN